MVVSNYFHELFQASGCVCDEVIDCVPSAVTDLVNSKLFQPIEDEEVRKAAFQMHPDKSLGPDWMTPAFFQKCWPIVGDEVVKTHMSNLRPIALSNVLFKIITKVMVNRMKPFMDSIIYENQSAFIPGRLISNNILVSFEVLHYLRTNRKGKNGFMALKLDMSKAYEQIEWDFLEAMLQKLGFVENWIQLIMKCVKSTRYCVTCGNNEVGPIIPTRGIRQGDPLSPYLFILCAEGFTTLLRKYEQRGWLHGCKVANGAPRVSHMLFADDSYLYCKATEDEARRIQEVLLKFELASGRKVNFPKSSIFFSTNTLSSMKDRINFILGMVTAVEVVTRDIEGLMSKFLWQSSSNSPKGIHWMSWKKLCKHKSKGGMGFRNLRSFNLALLGKQGWSLLTKPDTLVSAILKARYYPWGSFFTTDIGNNPNYVWRSVLEARQLVLKGVRWTVGDGTSISVLGEPWL
uniref:Reverse transcriptase domain-containing protein n=1 Tax=Cannabis sativa TaxID=3483 RepID=A0A803NHG8_CANSA